MCQRGIDLFDTCAQRLIINIDGRRIALICAAGQGGGKDLLQIGGRFHLFSRDLFRERVTDELYVDIADVLFDGRLDNSSRFVDRHACHADAVDRDVFRHHIGCGIQNDNFRHFIPLIAGACDDNDRCDHKKQYEDQAVGNQFLFVAFLSFFPGRSVPPGSGRGTGGPAG